MRGGRSPRPSGEIRDVNKREACQWVHTRLIVGDMVFDELVAAFTALVGRAPNAPDRREGLFGRCCDAVTSLTGVPRARRTRTKVPARRPSSS
jgi:hypothetical protein